jgi:creatinine amidohydrolase/Fe(II)-dependent formamide hydrolase-like protein
VRLGGRIPIPIAGPLWSFARQVAEVAGAPVPPHVLELMRHGRAGDATRAREALGSCGVRSTLDVCTELYEWGTVTPLRRGEQAA